MRTEPAGKNTPSKRRPTRPIVERLALVLVAAAILQTWYLGGLFVPMRITSSSMAPALRGPHRETVCGDCGFRFAFGTDGRPSRRTVCPNCGFTQIHQPGLPATGGDWAWISRPVFQLRQPQRWEVVAFRHPESASQLALKRVVGLPGETVEIREGDVYINGTIQRKPFAQQQACAVLVHDASHRPADDSLPLRWQGESSGSQWTWVDGRFVRPATPDQTSIDWLRYHHWQRLPGQPGQVEPCPITNTSGYNQAFPQRNEAVNPVADLWLSFRLANATGSGKLYVRLSDGREEFQLQVEPKQSRCRVFWNERELETLAPASFAQRNEGEQIDVSLIDRQLTVAFDGHVAGQWPYEPSPSQLPPPQTPVAIGACGLGGEIRDLRLYRDVYYTRPIGPDARWGVGGPYRLGERQYFVLGDNSVLSLDSRTWPQGPTVAEELLLGKPFLSPLAGHRVAWGRWTFVVPEFARIRYIR